MRSFPAGNTSIIMPSKLYQLKNNTTDFVLREEVVKYDAFGNPIEVIGKDNVHTVFLRSYHSRYIVAIIKDATFDQVSTAVQNHFGVAIDAFSAQSQPDTLKLHSFGNQASLSKALVTTFTYAPLVGMTSKTDPNGLTTYYGYDHSGRLESVTDHSGKTVEIYDYHYLNQ
jgi:YD repeat-containing protein